MSKVYRHYKCALKSIYYGMFYHAMMTVIWWNKEEARCQIWWGWQQKLWSKHFPASNQYTAAI